VEQSPSPQFADTASSLESEPETLEAEASTAPASTAAARWKWLLRLGMGLGILVLMITRGHTTTLVEALSRVPLWVLLASTSFYLAGQMLSALKWQMLLRAAGANVPFAQCCRFYLMGMFWNLWMPTNIGGDAVRIYAVRNYCPRLAVAASSVVVERLTGFFALLMLGAGGLVCIGLQGGGQSGAWRVVLMAFAVLTACLVLLIAIGKSKGESKGFAAKIRNKIASLSEAVLFYGAPGQRQTLVWSMLLSLVFQASQILLNIALAHVAGLAIPALTFWWLIPVLSLASLLPLGIGGLGVREAAAAALLGPAAPTGTIIAWSLLWQVTVWLSSLPGAWPVLIGKAKAAPPKP
jgi:uncharacterized protein (TIRG00374 family)